MVVTITDILNIWNDLGVFSYAIPFLLIFAVVFAILEKSKVLGENKAITSIVAISVGLLSLQFDFVSEFFAIIFPRFGIVISMFLVLLILVGFFRNGDEEDKVFKFLFAAGIIFGVGSVIWSLSEWDRWSNFGGFGGWFADYIWSLLILGGIIAVIVVASNSKSTSNSKSSSSSSGGRVLGGG